jgi:hypothetical protein
MWDDLARNAIGAVVLADTRQLDGCFAAVDYLEHRRMPFVVAVNQVRRRHASARASAARLRGGVGRPAPPHHRHLVQSTPSVSPVARSLTSAHPAVSVRVSVMLCVGSCCTWHRRWRTTWRAARPSWRTAATALKPNPR